MNHRPLIAAGILLGIGMGGLVDGIIFHQIFQIHNMMSAKLPPDMSLKMFITFCVGVGLWLTYGVLQSEIPIIVTNAVTLVLGLCILGMKIKYG